MPARLTVLARSAALVACALLPALSAPRAGAAESGTTPAALAAEREAVQAEHARAVLACRSRFAVTPCIESADEVRRRALQRIQAQEWALEEASRHQRAEARRLQREARAAEHARRAAAAPVSTQASAAAAPVAGSPAASASAATPEPRRGEAAARASGAARDAEARRRAERLSQRQEELAQRQARIQAREAQRAASGVRAEPLPRP